MLFLHTLFIFTLYRAPVDTSPVTERVTLFKHRLLLLLLLLIYHLYVFVLYFSYNGSNPKEARTENPLYE